MGVFVTNHRVAPGSQPTLFAGRLPEPVRWMIKVALVGSVVVSAVVEFQSEARTHATPGEFSGAWGVTAFARDPGAGTAPASPQWRRIIVGEASLVVRLDNDAMMRCRRTPAVDASTMAFACGQGRTGELRWTLAGTRAQLDGTFEGARLTVSARRLDDRDYPLMKGGLHLVYNR